MPILNTLCQQNHIRCLLCVTCDFSVFPGIIHLFSASVQYFDPFHCWVIFYFVDLLYYVVYYYLMNMLVIPIMLLWKFIYRFLWVFFLFFWGRISLCSSVWLWLTMSSPGWPVVYVLYEVLRNLFDSDSRPLSFQLIIISVV